MENVIPGNLINVSSICIYNVITVLGQDGKDCVVRHKAYI